MLERIFAADMVRGAVPPWMRHDAREILPAVRLGSSYNAPGKRPGGVGQEALHALGDFLERLDVQQLDIAAGLEPDLAVALHDGEGPAHDLGGEAEIIRDIGTSHWLVDRACIGLAVGRAMRQGQQERDDPLARCLAAEQQHPVPGLRRFAGGGTQKPLFKMRDLVKHRLEFRELIERQG